MSHSNSRSTSQSCNSEPKSLATDCPRDREHEQISATTSSPQNKPITERLQNLESTFRTQKPLRPRPYELRNNSATRYPTEPVSAVTTGKGNPLVATPHVDAKFVEDVVSIFKDQRKRCQFAVLILSSECQVTLRNMLHADGKMTDNSTPTYPPDIYLDNYIVSRPDRGSDAEILLLRRFPTLLKYNTQCQSIVLYSWLLPCLRCAEEIAHVLGQYTTTHRVTVVYTSTARMETEEEENTAIMKNAGIKVIKGDYSKY